MTLWNCWIVVRLFLIPMIGGISYKRRQWLIWGYGDTRLPSLRTRGPKCHTSRAEMSHKGQNVTQSCYNLKFYMRIGGSTADTVIIWGRGNHSKNKSRGFKISKSYNETSYQILKPNSEILWVEDNLNVNRQVNLVDRSRFVHPRANQPHAKPITTNKKLL